MDHKHDDKHGGGHHLVPLNVYFLTLGALLVLTIVTVGVSYLDFGKANIFVSMGIAFVKAGLVMAFFMGLRWDTNINRAFILSSFFALALLIFFGASDLWTRDKPVPVKVVAASGPMSKEDFAALETSTPALVAKGKEVFNVNCAVCHGAEGKGDGIGGAALNPKPRNFHGPASDWKNGTSGKSIYVTLANGIAGSGMASYKALAPEDRWALIHYVHTFTPEIQKESKADGLFAKAMEEDGIGSAGGGAPKASLPIDFAIERALKK